MKVYIPFNTIVDIDFGVIRVIENITGISEYPTNKLKSFLLNRENEDPIPEYCKLRGIEDSLRLDVLLEDKEYYKLILKVSNLTDILALVINTYKLGLSNEMEMIIACNTEDEMNYLKSVLSSLKYNIHMDLNTNLKLNDFDYIFTKYMDEHYINYLIDNEINRKRLYVADYRFNTIVDPETGDIGINPDYHLRLESEGIIVSTVSLYNKK